MSMRIRSVPRPRMLRPNSIELENGPTVKVAPPKDWREGKRLQERNLHMLQNKIDCDVVFEFGGKRKEKSDRIGAHSFLLMSASPLFRDLLARSKKDGRKSIQVSSDVQQEYVWMMLEYIYSERVSMTMENVAELLRISTKYKVFGLIGESLKFLLGHIEDDTVCSVLLLAIGYKCKSLRDRCLRYIDKNTETVFKTKHFLDLDQESLEMIITRDSLIVTEAAVYEGVMRWSRHQCALRGVSPTSENIRAELGNVFFHIRFPLMSPKYFTDHVATGDILRDAEKVDLFRYFYSSPKPKLVFSDVPRQWNKSGSGILCIQPSPDTPNTKVFFNDSF